MGTKKIGDLITDNMGVYEGTVSYTHLTLPTT